MVHAFEECPHSEDFVFVLGRTWALSICSEASKQRKALTRVYTETFINISSMKTSGEATKPSMECDMIEPMESGPGNVVVLDSSSGVDIITRVTQIPVVSSTIGQVTNMYTWTKGRSTLANRALGYAEKSVVVAAQTAKPVVDRFEKPISMASEFACHQLDKLEEKVPLISKPTDEVVSTIQDGTRQVIEGTKQKGVEGLNMLMNTRMGKVVSFGLDTALAVSEIAVDYYLPPDDAEKKQEMKDDYDEKETEMEKESPSSVQRVNTLSKKVRRRLHKKALMNIRYAQKRSQETIQKLHFTVDLIDYAKESIDGANQTIRTNAEAAQEKLWNTWNDWTTTEEGKEKETEHSEVTDKEGEQKTLAIARALAGRLRGLTQNIASSVAILPQHIHGKVEEARTMADNIYHSFEEAHYFSDISSSLLTTCREQLNNLSHVSMQVANYVINSSPVQWLIPNVEMEGIEFDYIPGSDQNDVDLTSDSSEF
ncbi:perilipin-2-like isoform X2 [Patiria miniata]|uniref:Perilipin n=1 Tax=Patiria miniata TaxID=46514 RepID=A0A914AY39_PATMI|nr:perilipin-2-like isoform X2 [Patiria miniata]